MTTEARTKMVGWTELPELCSVVESVGVWEFVEPVLLVGVEGDWLPVGEVSVDQSPVGDVSDGSVVGGVSVDPVNSVVDTGSDVVACWVPRMTPMLDRSL